MDFKKLFGSSLGGRAFTENRYPRLLFKNNYDVDAQALWARYSTTVSDSLKQPISDCFTGLKADGIYDLFDVICDIKASDTAQAAQRNWKGDVFNLAPVNSPVYTTRQYYTTNGSTTYLGTGYQAGISGQSLQNDSHISIWVGTNVATVGVDFGNASNFIRSYQQSNTSATTRSMTTSSTTTANAVSDGFYTISRSASGTYEFYRNGVLLANIAVASSAPSAFELYIGGFNNSGPISTGANRPYLLCTMGKALNATQVLAAYNRFNTLHNQV